MQSLGLSAAAESVYRGLLRQPGSNEDALAVAIGMAPAQIAAELALLRSRGLVHSDPGPTPSWFPTAPEAAVELLLMKRQAELNEARRVLPYLQADLREGQGGAMNQNIEVLDGSADVWRRAYVELMDGAHQDLACIVCPPFSGGDPDAINAARKRVHQRGVRCRTLMSPQVMGLQGWQSSLSPWLAAGEQWRLLDPLPFKLMLTEEVGLLPTQAGIANAPIVRLTRGTLHTGLWRLFEQLWQQGVPLGMEGAALSAAGDDADQQALLALMSAGAQDKVAASLLGISERTLLRRIQQLSTALDAKTRFQCGWLAARRYSDL